MRVPKWNNELVLLLVFVWEIGDYCVVSDPSAAGAACDCGEGVSILIVLLNCAFLITMGSLILYHVRGRIWVVAIWRLRMLRSLCQ